MRVSQDEAESAEAMEARVRASFERQPMMATLGVELAAVERGRVELALDHDEVVRAGRTLAVCHAEAVADGAAKPFAVMQATLTAVYDRLGIAH